MSRLLWTVTTPRRLRRNSLIFLLLWTGLAFAHHSEVFSEPHVTRVHTEIGVQVDTTR
ncbi:hypothetical protein [Mycolicibacterium aubagnense]|uniref:hypothetical protein n=1 Tax=Mycolicibacterium aubagnense TaxID=319707 RepID=UPI0013D4BE47|nr:hypothetical protein [Mycolicibacterium aubagnense]